MYNCFLIIGDIRSLLFKILIDKNNYFISKFKIYMIEKILELIKFI